MNYKIATLQEWIDGSKNILFFSGKGVSTESGIPDFLDTDEDYYKKYEFPPETIMTRTFFKRKPMEFFNFYRDKVLSPLTTAEPNATHYKLAELHAAKKLRKIITQNMDELHQEAGCRNVVEIYGSFMRNPCPKSECERRTTVFDIYSRPDVPYCDVDMCGEVMTPEIYLYGDSLDKDMMTTVIFDVLMCDVLIVAGTSLIEHPAAAIVNYYFKKKMVLINDKPHQSDQLANLVIHAPIHEVMEKIQVRI